MSQTIAELKQDQFVSLVQQHRGLVGKICFAYAANREAHDDLSQEILARLWQAFPGFDPERKFSTWMYRIALNVAIDSRRRERTRERNLPTSECDVAMVAARGDGHRELDEQLSVLQRALQTFDDFDRALILMVLEGCSHADVAEVLGISASNVGTRLHRLKERLRSELKDSPNP